MMRRQVALVGPEGDGLLRAHEERIGEAAQQHHQRENDIHDADLLVVDGGEPVAPQRTPPAHIGDEAQQSDTTDGDADERHEQDRLVIRNGFESQSPEDELLKIEIGKHGIASFPVVGEGTYRPIRYSSLMGSI